MMDLNSNHYVDLFDDLNKMTLVDLAITHKEVYRLVISH